MAEFDHPKVNQCSGQDVKIQIATAAPSADL